MQGLRGDLLEHNIVNGRIQSQHCNQAGNEHVEGFSHVGDRDIVQFGEILDCGVAQVVGDPFSHAVDEIDV